MTAASRVDWVDLAKGAAMLAVVYYHSSLFLGFEGVDNTLGRAKLAFELFPMPAFFLLSGLLARRMGRWRFSALWRRRLLPILYIYVVWTVLRFVFYTAFPFLSTDAADMAPNDPMTLLVMPVLPTSSYWFVYALAVFTLLVWLARRLPAWVHLAIAGLLSTAFTAGWLVTGTIAWDRIGALYAFFALGALASGQVRRYVERAPVWVVILCLAGLLGLVAGMYLFRGLLNWPFFVLTGQLLAVFLVFQVARFVAGWRIFGWLAVVGRQSLTIYLMHLFLVAPAAALVGLLEPDWRVWIDLPLCLLFTAAIIVACLGIARISRSVRWLYVPPRWLQRALSSRAGAKSAGV